MEHTVTLTSRDIQYICLALTVARANTVQSPTTAEYELLLAKLKPEYLKTAL